MLRHAPRSSRGAECKRFFAVLASRGGGERLMIHILTAVPLNKRPAVVVMLGGGGGEAAALLVWGNVAV